MIDLRGAMCSSKKLLWIRGFLGSRRIWDQEITFFSHAVNSLSTFSQLACNLLSFRCQLAFDFRLLRCQFDVNSLSTCFQLSVSLYERQQNHSPSVLTSWKWLLVFMHECLYLHDFPSRHCALLDVSGHTLESRYAEGRRSESTPHRILQKSFFTNLIYANLETEKSQLERNTLRTMEILTKDVAYHYHTLSYQKHSRKHVADDLHTVIYQKHARKHVGSHLNTSKCRHRHRPASQEATE